jgi:hypothetical protein
VFNTFVIDAYRRNIFDSAKVEGGHAKESEDQAQMKGEAVLDRTRGIG